MSNDDGKVELINEDTGFDHCGTKLMRLVKEQKMSLKKKEKRLDDVLLMDEDYIEKIRETCQRKLISWFKNCSAS